MDYCKENLKKIVEAITELIKVNGVITVKRIRIHYKIAGENRSQISFITRSLRWLKDQGILEVVRKKSPKSYKVVMPKKLNIEEILAML